MRIVLESRSGNAEIMFLRNKLALYKQIHYKVRLVVLLTATYCVLQDCHIADALIWSRDVSSLAVSAFHYFSLWFVVFVNSE